MWRFILPNTIIPKYGENDATEGFNIVSNNTTENNEKNEMKFKLTINLKSTNTISNIFSFSHNDSSISYDQSNSVLITYSSDKFPDVDYILKWKDKSLGKSQIMLQKDQEEIAGMISIIPKIKEDLNLEDEEVSGEYIFIVDRSGSMGGDRIEIAKQALVLCIKSLPEDSFVNIISFGSSYNKMYDEPIKITDDIIDNITTNIKSFDADFGGTEMYDPINYVLDCKIN